MIEACEFSGGSRALKGRDRVLFHALRMVCRSFRASCRGPATPCGGCGGTDLNPLSMLRGAWER